MFLSKRGLNWAQTRKVQFVSIYWLKTKCQGAIIKSYWEILPFFVGGCFCHTSICRRSWKTTRERCQTWSQWKPPTHTHILICTRPWEYSALPPAHALTVDDLLADKPSSGSPLTHLCSPFVTVTAVTGGGSDPAHLPLFVCLFLGKYAHHSACWLCTDMAPSYLSPWTQQRWITRPPMQKPAHSYNHCSYDKWHQQMALHVRLNRWVALQTASGFDRLRNKLVMMRKSNCLHI